MNSYIKEVKVNERIEEIKEPVLDLSILKKRSSGKTSSGICLGYIKKLHSKVPNEFILVLQNMYRDIKNLEVSETFKAHQWRGRSGVTYQIKPDYVIAIRFRKKDIGEKPIEVRTEMSKFDINKVRWAIHQLNENKLIETCDIAEKVYHKPWDKVFSNRPQHTLLVEILNYLEYKQEIKYYRSGKVEVLNQKKIE